MCNIRPIKTKLDFDNALARVMDTIDAEPGTPQADEHEILCDLVEHYECLHETIIDPTAGAMIEFWIDQRGWTVAQVNALPDVPQDIGAVIAGKAALTMRMALLLHEQVGIPEEYLLVSTISQPSSTEPAIT